ncbi:calcineurin-like phosphoesterase family protein [soil metagenome]
MRASLLLIVSLCAPCGIALADSGADLPMSAAPIASGPSCAGVVYVDANGNGHRDRRESPVVGVHVSDGAQVASTDRHGRYQFTPAAERRLFLIKPAGYRAATRGDGLPDTWAETPGSCRDFPLRRERLARGVALDVLVLGDPQPKIAKHLEYYQRDILDPLRANPRATLAVSLGDLVDDQQQLYPGLKQADATLGIPWLHAPGNHDVDAEGDDAHALGGFHAAFGPDTYAWEEAQANFVVLDDVITRPGGGKSYVGGLREEQFQFLAAYLSGADRSRLLVLALHIPLFDVGGVETFRHQDRARLFAMLAPFPHLLVLSAHTHSQMHVYHDASDGWVGATPLHEYNVGTACGAYWTGVKDTDGIPASTMSDGTPNGYARMRVSADASVAVRWYAARAPEDAQIGLHSPGVIRRGAYPGFGVYANVWMGGPDTTVEFRVDDGAWKPMARWNFPDPALVAENMRDDDAATLRGYDRATEAGMSTHLWRAAVPTDLALGEHRVDVRSQIDDFGLATASTTYRLEDAQP